MLQQCWLYNNDQTYTVPGQAYKTSLAVNQYCKFPKYSDTPKIVVITLKFDVCGSTIE